MHHRDTQIDPLGHSDCNISKHNVQQTNQENCLSRKKQFQSLFFESHSILTHSLFPPTFFSITNHKESMDALCFVCCQGNLVVIRVVWFPLQRSITCLTEWLNTSHANNLLKFSACMGFNSLLQMWNKSHPICYITASCTSSLNGWWRHHFMLLPVLCAAQGRPLSGGTRTMNKQPFCADSYICCSVSLHQSVVW